MLPTVRDAAPKFDFDNARATHCCGTSKFRPRFLLSLLMATMLVMPAETSSGTTAVAIPAGSTTSPARAVFQWRLAGLQPIFAGLPSSLPCSLRRAVRDSKKQGDSEVMIVYPSWNVVDGGDCIVSLYSDPLCTNFAIEEAGEQAHEPAPEEDIPMVLVVDGVSYDELSSDAARQEAFATAARSPIAELARRSGGAFVSRLDFLPAQSSATSVRMTLVLTLPASAGDAGKSSLLMALWDGSLESSVTAALKQHLEAEGMSGVGIRTSLVRSAQAAPTLGPTITPTSVPTAVPSVAPTAAPTAAPTFDPSAAPTAAPSATPTAPAPGRRLSSQLQRTVERNRSSVALADTARGLLELGMYASIGCAKLELRTPRGADRCAIQHLPVYAERLEEDGVWRSRWMLSQAWSLRWRGINCSSETSYDEAFLASRSSPTPEERLLSATEAASVDDAKDKTTLLLFSGWGFGASVGPFMWIFFVLLLVVQCAVHQQQDDLPRTAEAYRGASTSKYEWLFQGGQAVLRFDFSTPTAKLRRGAIVQPQGLSLEVPHRPMVCFKHMGTQIWTEYYCDGGGEALLRQATEADIHGHEYARLMFGVQVTLRSGTSVVRYDDNGSEQLASDWVVETVGVDLADGFRCLVRRESSYFWTSDRTLLEERLAYTPTATALAARSEVAWLLHGATARLNRQVLATERGSSATHKMLNKGDAVEVFGIAYAESTRILAKYLGNFYWIDYEADLLKKVTMSLSLSDARWLINGREAIVNKDIFGDHPVTRQSKAIMTGEKVVPVGCTFGENASDHRVLFQRGADHFWAGFLDTDGAPIFRRSPGVRAILVAFCDLVIHLLMTCEAFSCAVVLAVFVFVDPVVYGLFWAALLAPALMALLAFFLYGGRASTNDTQKNLESRQDTVLSGYVSSTFQRLCNGSDATTIAIRGGYLCGRGVSAGILAATAVVKPESPRGTDEKFWLLCAMEGSTLKVVELHVTVMNGSLHVGAVAAWERSGYSTTWTGSLEAEIDHHWQDFRRATLATSASDPGYGVTGVRYSQAYEFVPRIGDGMRLGAGEHAADAVLTSGRLAGADIAGGTAALRGTLVEKPGGPSESASERHWLLCAVEEPYLKVVELRVTSRGGNLYVRTAAAFRQAGYTKAWRGSLQSEVKAIFASMSPVAISTSFQQAGYGVVELQSSTANPVLPGFVPGRGRQICQGSDARTITFHSGFISGEGVLGGNILGSIKEKPGGPVGPQEKHWLLEATDASKKKVVELHVYVSDGSLHVRAATAWEHPTRSLRRFSSVITGVADSSRQAGLGATDLRYSRRAVRSSVQDETRFQKASDFFLNFLSRGSTFQQLPILNEAPSTQLPVVSASTSAVPSTSTRFRYMGCIRLNIKAGSNMAKAMEMNRSARVLDQKYGEDLKESFGPGERDNCPTMAAKAMVVLFIKFYLYWFGIAKHLKYENRFFWALLRDRRRRRKLSLSPNTVVAVLLLGQFRLLSAPLVYLTFFPDQSSHPRRKIIMFDQVAGLFASFIRLLLLAIDRSLQPALEQGSEGDQRIAYQVALSLSIATMVTSILATCLLVIYGELFDRALQPASLPTATTSTPTMLPTTSTYQPQISGLPTFQSTPESSKIKAWKKKPQKGPNSSSSSSCGHAHDSALPFQQALQSLEDSAGSQHHVSVGNEVVHLAKPKVIGAPGLDGAARTYTGLGELQFGSTCAKLAELAKDGTPDPDEMRAVIDANCRKEVPEVYRNPCLYDMRSSLVTRRQQVAEGMFAGGRTEEEISALKDVYAENTVGEEIIGVSSSAPAIMYAADVPVAEDEGIVGMTQSQLGRRVSARRSSNFEVLLGATEEDVAKARRKRDKLLKKQTRRH
eukprot:TRINITY_DN17171_c1_g7_i1.p1 TRINITY_DN17171_c1_g7~~TRINITY_DN17171_c1_g7_i1.p1  ORF type:complete len:1860 (+),score=356.59 TRINITY_DN17171_c1_g7_i1:210-5789(+)